ncbi:unnamed protein product [Chilo suppressalis]|uniref:Citrate transporter-like domain-containing protein n=1 Tax=Chilo suppressalis TaxID=168631 RepID=A0ABN8ATH3_CHISP|nr:hypothetical protein evm_008911 [Chilo suppressalis]CAH0397948.1 unnamed protein product [Chilo suppressalis]
MFSSAKPEETLSAFQRLKLFLAIHWKGLLTLLTPIVLLFIILPLPAKPHAWVAYTLVNMAVFWVTECIPLAVTSFLPIVIFPLSGVMTTAAVCRTYVNDTIIMFVGSLILAYSIEQSGLHKRLAFFTIRMIGYSHIKLLFAMCCVTTFVSMWITNTAATTMMVPINFAILRVFEGQNLLKVFEYNEAGERVASDITTSYFCAATFSATIGGIGTLVGTGTNIAFKGLFMSEYPKAPELLSFPLFSAFGVPYMIALEAANYLYLAIVYFGLFRPNSPIARSTKITPQGIAAAKIAIERDTKKLGTFSFWEGMVSILFMGAMVCFFCRSPQIFEGWGDKLRLYFEKDDEKYVRDSALAMLVGAAMFLFPRSLDILKNFSVKYTDELPKGKILSVLDWRLLNSEMPWSFMFLLGGGFSLSEGAKISGLNDKIGEQLMFLNKLPNPAVILIIAIIVTFLTNFASNVAVANVMVPLAMQIAKRINVNPLWYAVVSGFSASFCFMMPVGTPGNLVIQSAASIPTTKMIKAGSGVTVTTLILTWFFMTYYAPVIWPMYEMPDWIEN